MALDTANFAGIVAGSIKIFNYVSADDTLATIVADDYFADADLVDRLDVGDLIIANGSNLSAIVRVTKVVKTKTAMEVDVVALSATALA